MITVSCSRCGKAIQTYSSLAARKKFCSRSCLAQSRTGRSAGNFKDGGQFFIAHADSAGVSLSDRCETTIVPRSASGHRGRRHFSPALSVVGGMALWIILAESSAPRSAPTKLTPPGAGHSIR
jgi:hypothetical protein